MYLHNGQDHVGAQRADELILQVCIAHVEAERFHAFAVEIGAEAGPLERAPKVALLAGVAEPRESDVESARAKAVECACDRLCATDRHDGDAFCLKVAAAPLCERLDGDLIAGSLDQDHCSQRLDHLPIFATRSCSAKPQSLRLATMASAGDVLENPSAGERLVFLRTAAETGGEVLEYELEFVPRGFAVRDHLHPLQEERHEVLDGSLGIVAAGRERTLGPGDVEVVPVATQHRIFATGDTPIRVRFASRPALESEVLLETLFGLARDGKVGKRGDPSVLQLAVIFDEFAELGRPVKPSPGVQRALFAPLAALGRARGYRARYPEYSHGT